MLTPDHPTCKSDAGSAQLATMLALLCITLLGCTTVERQSFTVPQNRNVEAAAQRWSTLFRQFLDQNLGR